VPSSSDRLLDEPEEVRQEERLDPERLRPFLEEALGVPGPFEVLQFRKGHSNLTYLVKAGAREAVLRRAPFGVQVKSAHDMRREFTILSALQGHYPQAPRPIAFCDDESLAGARFYLMERVRGVVLRGDGSQSGLSLSPPLLRAISTGVVDNLVRLHGVDLDATRLSAVGRPEGYVARQVAGWTDRWHRARTEGVPDVEPLLAWLAGNVPPESGATLVHNDYKYDNLVLDPADPSRVVAVLDWEMATVGDPLLDLGNTVAYWVDADDPEELRARAYGPTWLPGSLSRVEVAARYEELSGRKVGPLLFQYVFAVFRLAVILQQIYKRYRDGHTRDPRFGPLIQVVGVLARQAGRALDKGRIHGLGKG
jgi:aminoglycoside phosphotransferase (APT) family kinase protein